MHCNGLTARRLGGALQWFCLEQLEPRLLLSGVAPKPGDANGDGFVDAADYAIWAANVGATGGATWGTGDFNSDGFIDAADYAIWAANVGATAAPKLVQSDDFSSGVLNASIWQFIDPKGDAALAFNGVDAVISLPAGSEHDMWQGYHNAPRLMQSVDDLDFEIEAKFESRPAGAYAMNGIIVQADENDFITFQFQSTGATSMILLSTSFAGDRPTVRLNRGVAGQGTMYMRVNRQGDQWTETYSYDGVNWRAAASFTCSLPVSEVGVYVANAGVHGGDEPAYAGVIDYFFNTASPIIPEDGPPPADTTPPQILNVNTSSAADYLQVAFNTDEPATTIVKYGLTDSYELGTASESGAAGLSHTVTVSGLAAGTLYQYCIVATDTSGNVRTGANMSASTTAADQAGPLISIWYGDSQSFGQVGNPQRWVNILGNVSDPDGVASLSYTLNGGVSQYLSIGPDLRRLEHAGDFNVEIAQTALVQGDNTVVVTAIDSLAKISTTTVTFQYTSANIWPLPYVADWSGAASISQVAQVVDGNWAIVNGELEPVSLGYDRTVAIGDMSWTDYEVTVPITIHGIDPAGFRWPSGSPGLGLVMRWQGHYDWDGSQPTYGWYPIGGTAWYAWNSDGTNSLDLEGNNSAISPIESRTLAVGTTYIWKVRCQTQPGGGTLYSLKIWQEGTPEPAAWELQGYGPSDELTAGSLLIVAHHVDASFGTVTITPL